MQKVVIVTGASRGIGAATALLLAKEGYGVCVNYRQRQDQAQALVAQIQAQGGQAMACQADVTQEADVARLFECTARQLGPVTHLVNNAGILFTQTPFEGISLARFSQVLSTHVLGCFLCCRQALGQLPRGGAIVNVSSAAARTGAPFEYIDYAAAKGAMDSLTKGLALEVAERGIRVNGVRPGFIHTQMHADGGEPDRVARLSPQIPLKRGGSPEEVANAIAWLLSDQASFVTGSILDIAGGK
ncbi:SDR family oxidoreductase [Gallaecimonas xiamenensis]|uniref:Oxidoreductase short-chain dehydrogenase/reductase family protein n=1 Tax=Gallaecimonas xiamenensis 3-C-1 TaxID=745411 RepID=K2KKH2_9GAMM|nr:SDR family oxidoreductase [Gallaecimonas xiamenensis]EKE77900.1 oxidoreductase short-chain dehydrogenase/reductase family protein [Gallaecimonas xiamenensis 3-C-1]